MMQFVPVADLAVPIRPGEAGVRQVPERSVVLVTRRTQEPGRLDLHPAQVPHSSERCQRYQVSLFLNLINNTYWVSVIQLAL